MEVTDVIQRLFLVINCRAWPAVEMVPMCQRFGHMMMLWCSTSMVDGDL